MSLVSELNETAMIIWLTKFSRNAIPASAAMAFGPITMLPRASSEAKDFISNPDDFQPSWSTRDTYSGVALGIGKLVDRWIISRGGVALADVRTYRFMKTLQTGWAVRTAVSRAVPAVAVATVATYATTNLIEGVIVGTVVGNQRHPKPAWMPLIVWHLAGFA